MDLPTESLLEVAARVRSNDIPPTGNLCGNNKPTRGAWSAARSSNVLARIAGYDRGARRAWTHALSRGSVPVAGQGRRRRAARIDQMRAAQRTGLVHDVHVKRLASGPSIQRRIAGGSTVIAVDFVAAPWVSFPPDR